MVRNGKNNAPTPPDGSSALTVQGLAVGDDHGFAVLSELDVSHCRQLLVSPPSAALALSPGLTVLRLAGVDGLNDSAIATLVAALLISIT